MEVNFFENKKAWGEIDPEGIESFSVGFGEDIKFCFVTLHFKEKGKEEVIFVNLPSSLFFCFQEEWETLHANKP